MSDRLAAAERMTTSATNEAAYYRAKLSAMETGNAGEAQQLERGRASDHESHIRAIMTERWGQDRQINELKDSLALQTALYDQEQARALDAIKRADKMDETHTHTVQMYNDLLDTHEAMEAKFRDHQDRLISQSSLLEQREAEEISLRSQVEELSLSKDQHIKSLDQMRAALTASSARAIEIDMRYQQAQDQIKTLEADLAELRGDLEMRTTEAETARARLTDVENSWAKSREEADAFRALTTTSLGELLDTHRDLKADEDRFMRGHSEKVQAVEAEAQSVRMLLREANQRVDEATKTLAEVRKKNREHETGETALHSQIVSLRGQLSNSLADVVRLKKDMSALENSVEDKSKEVFETNAKLNALRSYLVDNGVTVGEDGSRSLSRGNGTMSPEASDLASKLAERTRQHASSERELAEALRQKRDAEVQVAQLSEELDQSRSSRSPSSTADVDARVQEVEERLESTTQAFKDQIQQMEADYQIAVHYVKYVYCPYSSTPP